jgi:aryl-alcohol dehydrogenase-like predicted oxidoreductase
VKELCLGTAMWGWSIDRGTAFSMLDYFYSVGGRHVDTANNYPLNENSCDYRKSPLFLSEWCKTRKVDDLKITYKIGSLSNINSPKNNLSPNHLNSQVSWAKDHFGENLSCIMIHWD